MAPRSTDDDLHSDVSALDSAVGQLQNATGRMDVALATLTADNRDIKAHLTQLAQQVAVSSQLVNTLVNVVQTGANGQPSIVERTATTEATMKALTREFVNWRKEEHSRSVVKAQARADEKAAAIGGRATIIGAFVTVIGSAVLSVASAVYNFTHTK